MRPLFSTLSVLVLGKDSRTYAIVLALKRAGCRVFTICDFDNPRLKKLSDLFLCAKTDHVATVVEFAKRERPDFAVIGPEEPLAVGVVDALLSIGIPSVGPTKKLAQIESSKSFTRQLLTKHHIEGNVRHKVFRNSDGLEGYLRHLRDFVVKADGLMGGKGVKVFGEQLQSIDDALRFAKKLIESGPVVIEERLDGEEFSLQSLCDGDTVVHLLPVQDHKRAFDGDTGPNTGGMGSYSCENHSLPFLREIDLFAARNINTRVAHALQEETGQPYKGILYGGFMATADGVHVLEYNARFGDPEALNILPILRTDFAKLCSAITEGTLSRLNVEFERKATVCKYLVPDGYPDRAVRDVRVSTDIVPPSRRDLEVYFGAVAGSDDELVLTGSRAIAFVGIGDSLAEAEQKAEAAISQVPGAVYHRRDIGTSTLVQKRIEHMEHLRRKKMSA